MPPRAPKKDPPHSKLFMMLKQAKCRANYFTTPEGLPYAALPTGQCVPVWSEDYYRWFSVTIYEQGIVYPTPQQYGAALRNLDEEAHSTYMVRQVHLRSAETTPNQFRFDIQCHHGNTILLNGKDWRVDELDWNTGGDTLYRRPTNSLPYPFPRKTSVHLDTYLENLLKIDDKQSRQLRDWLVQALLPTGAPVPFLILKGKAREEAASALRNLIDPAVNPIHAMPYTAKGINELAQHNRMLAFSIFGQLSKGKVTTLKALRAGTMVPLWERNKRGPQIEAKLQRPIIIASDEDLKLDEEVFTLEVNETMATYPDEFFGALLTAAATFIRKNTKVDRPMFAEPTIPTTIAVPAQEPQAPAPYS